MDFLKRIIGFGCFFTAIIFSVSAQSADEQRQLKDGDRLMELGEYDQALSSFQFIRHLPDVSFKMTVCSLMSRSFMNVPVEQVLAFQSSKGQDPAYQYWLAKILFRRLRMSESQQYLTSFLEMSRGLSGYASQRRDAENLLAFMATYPQHITVLPLESPINSRYAEIGGISRSGHQLVFASDRNHTGKFEVYTTSKAGESWQAPTRVNTGTLAPETIDVLDVGGEMTYYNAQEGVLYRINADGSFAEKLRVGNLLTDQVRHIYINKYETRIIFSMPNGANGLDLFETYKLSSTGEWMTPEPVAPHLNTSYHEDYPFLTDDRMRLYFCSDRPGGLGKMDIYFCDYDTARNTWGAPQNAGILINSMDNDVGFRLLPSGEGMISSDRVSTLGDYDLFMVKGVE